MTYELMRDNEQFAQLDGAISDFISRYKVNSVNPIVPRKTVILFPGGMASRLRRARTAYAPNLASYFYDVRWLDKSIAFGAALELQMANDIDLAQRIVIADGPVDFGLYLPPVVIGYVPYQGFIDWCDQQRIDWFIFGWDWRRRMEFTVDMFLNRFLPQFQARVQLECKADPLADFSLVGHSFGGMVVKLIVNQAAHVFIIQMQNAITVGSPFYGYAGHVHRYFEGDDSLIFYDRSSMARVVSSLQGGYTLLFLDEATYNIVQPHLLADTYPLYDYPSRDAGDNSIADPYNPIDLATKFRYPQKYGFQPLELARGGYLPTGGAQSRCCSSAKVL
jgi:pimeloyl-ACP methyl ester carboxylesterase